MVLPPNHLIQTPLLINLHSIPQRIACNKAFQPSRSPGSAINVVNITTPSHQTDSSFTAEEEA